MAKVIGPAAVLVVVVFVAVLVVALVMVPPEAGTSFSSALACSSWITQLSMYSVVRGVLFALRNCTALMTRSYKTPEPGTASVIYSISNSRDVSFGKIGTCTGAGQSLSSSFGAYACHCRR